MTTTLPIPVDRYLIPADIAPAVPSGAVRVRQPLVRGLPATIALDQDLSLGVLVVTGTAKQWIEAQGSELICASDEDGAPRQPDDDEEPVARAAARLVLLRGQTIIATVPLRAGLTRRLPDDGGAGAVIDLWILSYALHAGTLREVGDFGSYVELAWQRIDRGTDRFDLAPLDPRVEERLLAKIRAAALPSSPPPPRGTR